MAPSTWMRHGAGGGNSYPASGGAARRLPKPRAPRRGSLPWLLALPPPTPAGICRQPFQRALPLPPPSVVPRSGAGSSTPLTGQLTPSLWACEAAAGVGDTAPLFQLGQEELAALPKAYFGATIVCKHNNKVPEGLLGAEALSPRQGIEDSHQNERTARPGQRKAERCCAVEVALKAELSEEKRVYGFRERSGFKCLLSEIT